MHFNNINNKRAVSPVIAAIIMIVLVLAASTIVSVIILNINVIDLSSYLGVSTTTSQSPEFSVVVLNISDSDVDSWNDTIELSITLSSNSPNIYVNDIDILLPSGITLDTYAAWYIVSTTQIWNEEFYGYYINTGTINATFTAKCSDLSNDNAELESGQAFYILISYNVVIRSNNRVRLETNIFQTPLLYS